MKVAVIGAGFSGIAAATLLAEQGYAVTVYEKNPSPGGRARKFEKDGFVFDMGPSWYWMPDVFEKYFRQFGRQVSSYYQLERLAPSYRVFFGREDIIDVPADLAEFYEMIASLEPDSKEKLTKFLEDAQYKYKAGMHNLVYVPGNSPLEFVNRKTITGLFKLDLLKPISKYLRKYFRHPQVLQLLEFPILFLGAMPKNTPALYSLMNYADIKLGTWYPKGGMYKIIEGMVKLAREKEVKFIFNAPVERIDIAGNRANALIINGEHISVDAVVNSADYHHVEQTLIPPKYRLYNKDYWEKRMLAPSSLIYYVGINKKLDNLIHHNLFFDTDFERHAKEIYEHPQWPENPLFYACCPSKTDKTVAPEGCENLFILIPTAPGLMEDESVKAKYFELVLKRLEALTGQSIKEHIVFQRSYGATNFVEDYNAFKGNAYGLANTLRQTAFLKPAIRNKKIKNLYNAGQLTVPGPGVPPALISGQIAAKELIRNVES